MGDFSWQETSFDGGNNMLGDARMEFCYWRETFLRKKNLLVVGTIRLGTSGWISSTGGDFFRWQEESVYGGNDMSEDCPRSGRNQRDVLQLWMSWRVHAWLRV